MATVDLTGNVAVTTALLADPLAWRIRVVEQIDVDSPVSTFRRRSLQCAPLRPLLSCVGAVDPGPDPDQVALVVLPIAPVAKGPLLEFDVTGPGASDAFLLQRAEIASREAALVRALASDAAVTVGDRALAIIEAALGFTEATWQRYRPELRRYLAEGTSLAVDDEHIGRWIKLSQRAATLLQPYAETPRPLDSAIETPALVVPSLLKEGVLSSAAEATAALADYVAVIHAAVATAEDPMSNVRVSAGTLLESLADYGYHYDLLAVVRVPLDEPFVVKMSERRRLHLSTVKNDGTQELVISDARSNHVALRVVDPNARLSHVEARDVLSGGTAYGTFAYTATPQVHSLYSFEQDRPYRVVLHFRVSALRRLQLVPYALAGLLFLLAVVVCTTDPGPRELALLVGPGALASSVLLAREPSALGSRLRRLSTLLVVTAMATLVLVAGVQYIRR